MLAETDGLTSLTTPYRIRLPAADVSALRSIARLESARLGTTLGWCDLVRGAIAELVRDGRARPASAAPTHSI